MSSSPEAASSPASMFEIDYEALAKAAWEVNTTHPWELLAQSWREEQATMARAVVSAYEQQLLDQGMVVVRRDDVFWAVNHYEWQWPDGVDKRLSSALVAAPASAEQTS